MKTKRKCGVKHAFGSSGCKFMMFFLMYQIFWKVFFKNSHYRPKYNTAFTAKIISNFFL